MDGNQTTWRRRLTLPLPLAFALAGACAALLYLAAIIVGGMIISGYSHLANTISELTLADSPGRALLRTLFVAYNALLIVFALGSTSATLPESRAVAVGSWLLACIGVAGIGMSTVFPTDRPTDPLTTTGSIHIGLAAFASLGSMAAILSFSLGFWQVRQWRPFAAFSLASLAAIFGSGIWTAISATQLSPLMGLAERVTIGIFIAWLFVFSLRLAWPPRS